MNFHELLYRMENIVQHPLGPFEGLLKTYGRGIFFEHELPRMTTNFHELFCRMENILYFCILKKE